MSTHYPSTRRLDLVDTIHGVPVADPYRWLEDPHSVETAAWVDAQNALTRSKLDGSARDALVKDLTSRFNYARTGTLVRRGTRHFYTHNPGLLNQPRLIVREHGSPSDRVVLDPNLLSADGTIALTAFAPSSDGSLIAYALSQDGSDRQVVHVRETDSGVDRADALEHVKFASLAWAVDSTGLYYLRFPSPGSVAVEDEQYFGRIYFHRLGEPQANDDLVFETPDYKDVVPMVRVTSDGRWAVITAQRGASDDSEVHVVDRRRHASSRPIFTGFDAAYDVIDADGGRLYVRTTRDAPRGRIVSIDPDEPNGGMREVVPQSEHRLSSAVMARQTLVATYLQNASDRLVSFGLDGSARGEIPLPGIGSVVAIDAQPDDDEVRFVFTSFTQPPRPMVFRVAEGTAPGTATAMLPEAFDGFDAAPAETRYETAQVWYPSRDGTRVSMFLVHRADLPRDGNRPVLLSGYGGFNISRTPAYDPGTFPFLDRGGVFALANLRGGGEYGEEWHRDGMLAKKQNVFDDFIAAAEFLIAERYTSARRLAIEGGSNGGLLVGAVMTQRPELFGAVLCRVPVADMLRYHLFTVGRFWIPEYGCADDAAQFEYLLKYSPYHCVRPGICYPPTLVMTADTDDRVAPGMAKKFAARLQAEGSGGPILIRIETRAGHGAGKPIAKVIEEEADMLQFLFGSLS